MVIAKKEPHAAGIPLQPVVEELQGTAEKGGYGAVLPARPYRDRDLVDTGMMQPAPSSTPAQWPTTLKKLLVVGKATEDAWALASEALMAHKSLQEVAAIVNVGRPGAAPAIDTMLRSVGCSKEKLALTGAHLSVTATSRSSQWEPVDPGPAVWPPGYRLLLRWSTKETPEDKAPQPLAAVVTAGIAGMARLYCSLDNLEVADGLPPNRTKADATRWGCRVAWDHLKEIVQPRLKQRPPMAVRGGPGDTLEVAMDLQMEQVRSAVRHSGRCPGVEYWAGKPAPEAPTTTTVWMNLPTEIRTTTADIWTRLQEAPWFAGIRAGDRPGRIGVSVWGHAPVCDDIRGRLVAELGTEVKQPKTLARVYGYGPGFGLDACEPDSYAQQEVRRLWPSMDVKLLDCQHLTRSGLQRPTFALTLEGVPKEWEQSILRESDARLRQKVWVRCVTQQAAGQRKHVGPGAQLVRGPRPEAEDPSQQLAQQEPWRSPQNDEVVSEDEDMNGAGRL